MNDEVNISELQAREEENDRKRKRTRWIVVIVAGVVLVAIVILLCLLRACNKEEPTPPVDIGLAGTGTEEDPYILEHSGIYRPVVDAGKSAFFLYHASKDGMILLDVKGVAIQVTDRITGAYVRAYDRLVVKVDPNSDLLIELCWPNPGFEGEMVFEFLDEYDCLGAIPENPYIMTASGTYSLYARPNKTKYYAYSADKNGEVWFRVPTDAGITVIDKTTGKVYTDEDGDGIVEVPVTPDSELDIRTKWKNPEKEGDLSVELITERDYIPGVPGNGTTPDTPYIIPGTGLYGTTMGEGQSKYFLYTYKEEGCVRVKLPVGVNFVVTDLESGKTYVDSNGDGVLYIHLPAGSTIQIKTNWIDPAWSGTFDLDFTDESDIICDVEGVGKPNDPYIISGTGIYPTDVGKGEDKYFKYEATDDGYVKVEVPADADVVVIDKTTGETYTDEDGDGVIVLPVTPDSDLEIQVGWKDPDKEGELELDFTDERDYNPELEGNGSKKDPYVLYHSGIYPAYVEAIEGTHFIYTASEKGFIRVDARHATIVLTNTATGATYIVKNGGILAVNPGDTVTIELRGDGISDLGWVDMIFQDEKDYIDPSEVAIAIQTIRRYELGGAMVDSTGESIHVMPGRTLRYETGVKSLDTGDAWVRMRVTITVKDRNGEVMPHTDEELARIIEIAFDTDNWEQIGDEGWWYYKKVLPGNKTTPLLFDKITFSGLNITGAYGKGTVELLIESQAVQAKGNAGNPADVQGWPIA